MKKDWESIQKLFVFLSDEPLMIPKIITIFGYFNTEHIHCSIA